MEKIVQQLRRSAGPVKALHEFGGRRRLRLDCWIGDQGREILCELLIAPVDLQNAVLERTDQIACKLLELLPHTPAGAVGLNFGYREVDAAPEILEKFPSLFAEEFAANDLILNQKRFAGRSRAAIGHSTSSLIRVSVSNPAETVTSFVPVP